MPLVKCEIKLILTWSKKCIIVSNNVANHAITDTKI